MSTPPGNQRAHFCGCRAYKLKLIIRAAFRRVAVAATTALMLFGFRWARGSRLRHHRRQPTAWRHEDGKCCRVDLHAAVRTVS